MTTVDLTLAFATKIDDDLSYPENFSVRLNVVKQSTSTEHTRGDIVQTGSEQKRQFMLAWLLESNNATGSFKSAIEMFRFVDRFGQNKQHLSRQDTVPMATKAIQECTNITLDTSRSYDDLEKLEDQARAIPTSWVPEFHVEFQPEEDMPNMDIEGAEAYQSDEKLTEAIYGSIIAAEYFRRVLTILVHHNDAQKALTEGNSGFMATVVDLVLTQAYKWTCNTHVPIRRINVVGAYLLNLQLTDTIGKIQRTGNSVKGEDQNLGPET
ncbi:MAG: hypothetical protein TREMPRED_005428 [Tremellales sp. Tagirdzhanova-0007]|nr:MAG: hypothetical protein TREMPRED_005428 [Tremellales sp. Tagirdzhanova-0007]